MSAETEAEYAMRLQRALTELAGGGSELFIKHGDGFRADIAFCVSRIRKREEFHHDTIKRLILKAKQEARV